MKGQRELSSGSLSTRKFGKFQAGAGAGSGAEARTSKESQFLGTQFPLAHTYPHGLWP